MKTIMVLAVMFIGYLIYSCIHEESVWDDFKVAHKCKVVAHITGDIFTTFGIGGNGQPTTGVGSTPDKTGYLCDDGITYYR